MTEEKILGREESFSHFTSFCLFSLTEVGILQGDGGGDGVFPCMSWGNSRGCWSSELLVTLVSRTESTLPLSASSPKQLNLSVQIMVAAQPRSCADLLPVAYQLQHSPLEGRKRRRRWWERDDDEEGRGAALRQILCPLHCIIQHVGHIWDRQKRWEGGTEVLRKMEGRWRKWLWKQVLIFKNTLTCATCAKWRAIWLKRRTLDTLQHHLPPPPDYTHCIPSLWYL